MEAFVLDASVAISWCFPGDSTEDTPYSRRILQEMIVRDAIVPGIWPYEIANNIFVSYQKRKRISQQQIHEYMGLLTSLPIRMAEEPLWKSVELESVARSWGMTAYDASYLALALQEKIPLATSDALLRRKALESGVEVLAWFGSA